VDPLLSVVMLADNERDGIVATWTLLKYGFSV
jgi:hypothetical protein